MTATPAAPAAAAIDRRGVFAWMLFDWANQPFQTLIVTFIFAPYFVAEVIGDPVRGQALWGTAAAIGGAVVALLAPLLGAIADRTGARKRWVLGFSVPYVLGCLGFWLATPGDGATPRIVLVVYVVAFVGSEFGTVFTNAMLPGLGPRAEIGRISGSGWALGYLGGLVSLVFVLLFLAPAPGGTRTLLGIAPILGLDLAAGEPARATGPLSALWYVVFALPFFLWTPDEPAAPRRRRSLRAGLADLAATFRARAAPPQLLRLPDRLDGLSRRAGRALHLRRHLRRRRPRLGPLPARRLRHRRRRGRRGRRLGRRPRRPRLRAAAGDRRLDLAADRRRHRRAADHPHQRARPRRSPPARSCPDLVFMLAGGLLGAAAGALQAASRTLLVHQAEGRVAPAQAFGLFALSGRATAFIGPALIAVVTARDRLAAARGEPGHPAFPRRPRPAILGQNRQRAAQGTLRMIRSRARDLPRARRLAAPGQAQTAMSLFAGPATPSPHPTQSIGQRRRAAASPAACSCPRAARPGRRCGSAATTTGATRR